MKYCKNEMAVSPLLGLFVLICLGFVILAIIGYFVYTNPVITNRDLRVTVHQPSDDLVSVTYLGGPAASDLVSLNISYTAPGQKPQIKYLEPLTPPVTIGSNAAFKADPGTTFGNGGRVLIIATFRDKSKRMVYDNIPDA